MPTNEKSDSLIRNHHYLETIAGVLKDQYSAFFNIFSILNTMYYQSIPWSLEVNAKRMTSKSRPAIGDRSSLEALVVSSSQCT